MSESYIAEAIYVLREERVSLWGDLCRSVRGSMEWDWIVARIQRISRFLDEPTPWKSIEWKLLDVYESVERGAGVTPETIDWPLVERLKASL
jgi:hypothetical protein